jgi:hypothetical protein
MYFFVEKQKEHLTNEGKSGRIRKLGVRSEELGVDKHGQLLTPNSSLLTQNDLSSFPRR